MTVTSALPGPRRCRAAGGAAGRRDAARPGRGRDALVATERRGLRATGRSWPTCGRWGCGWSRRRGGRRALALHRARHARRQRLRAAGRADLRDPRHAGAGGRRGGAGGDPRARDRPCDRPATRVTLRGDRGAAGGGVRRRPQGHGADDAGRLRPGGARPTSWRRCWPATRSRRAWHGAEPDRRGGGDHPALADRLRAARGARPGGEAGRGVRQPRAIPRRDRRHGLGRRAGAGLRARAGASCIRTCASPSTRRRAMRWPTGRTR